MSLLLLQIIATQTCCFYRQSMSLDTSLLPESLLFPAYLSFPPVVLGKMSISLSAANWVWFFWGARMHLCLLVQNRVVYSTLYFSSLPFFIPFFLSSFSGWRLKVKEWNRPFVLFRLVSEMQRNNCHRSFVAQIYFFILFFPKTHEMNHKFISRMLDVIPGWFFTISCNRESRGSFFLN